MQKIQVEINKVKMYSNKYDCPNCETELCFHEDKLKIATECIKNNNNEEQLVKKYEKYEKYKTELSEQIDALEYNTKCKKQIIQ